MALRGFITVAVGLLMLTVGCAPSAGDPATYRVKYYASVGGDGSDSLEITYFHDSTQNTVTPPGPAWEETFEIENPSLPHVEIDVSVSRGWQPPDSSPGDLVPVPQAPPYAFCGIEVDGVEQARDEGAYSVRCSVDLRELDGSASQGSTDSAEQSDASGVVVGWVSLAFVLLLLSVVTYGAWVSIRNAKPQVAPAGQTGSARDPLLDSGGDLREFQGDPLPAERTAGEVLATPSSIRLEPPRMRRLSRRLVVFDPLSPQPTARALTLAIVVAALMALAYAVAMLVDLVKPPLPQSPLSFIRLVPIPFPPVWHVTEVFMFVAWGIAAAAGMIGFALARVGTTDARPVRICQIVAVVALFAPYVVFPVTIILDDIGHLLLCVPTTAFGLWLLRPMQAFRRVPVRLVLAAFGWGVFIAAGFSICMYGWFTHSAGNYFLDFDFADLEGMQTRLFTSAALNSGIFSELGKIAGITLLFMFCRRHFDGLTSGIVIGAAVGLGLNFVRSLQYMNDSNVVSLLNAGGAASQYWSHQVLGLMAGEVAFGAIVGAGFGIARRLPTSRQRWFAVLSCCLCAMAAHFATDVVLPHFLVDKIRWSREQPWLETLVVEPLLAAGTSGLFVVLYLLLLRHGRRAEAAGISEAAAAEAASDSGAITSSETVTLISPAARFFTRISALRDNGWQRYRAVRDLHAAQLDLLTSRWRADADEPELRERVLTRKHDLQNPFVTEEATS